MVERLKLDRLDEQKKSRAAPNRMTFTDLGIRRLKPPAEGQLLYWDKGQSGLALLVSSGGTKTFRSQFKLHGKWQTRSLGRFGEMKPNDDSENVNVATAREMTRNDRALALKGTDPREQARLDEPSSETYGAVVDQFVEQYAKRRQRTWDQTERALRGSKHEQAHGTGIAQWSRRPIVSITKREAYNLLEGMIAEERDAKAQITLAWLRTLWRWAYKRDIVAAPIMDTVEIEVERRRRTKVFDDDAIRATWRAADKLDPVEAAYVKLLILLAPRKTALSEMRRSHLDDPDSPTLWTTPPELVKQNLRAQHNDDPRVYLTPLPALAARLIKSVPRRGEDLDLIFPSKTVSGRPLSPSGPLTAKLVEAGAPADFQFHAWRHTVTTWLQNEGHDKFDRGLILNHAESGVTAGYSHGYALERKRALLEKWAVNVAELVAPELLA